MAKQTLSAGVTGLSSPLQTLAPGKLSRLTAAERAKKLKRTPKQVPNQAALMTPASILGK